ncbi:MAG TPA: hypothetical protein VKW06_15835 [Candidatus Angelobacter sp.]|nr:hypothetical protein [Candidatus Angelobacter sp.]
MERKTIQLESFRTRRAGWLSGVAAVVVAVLGYLLDKVFIHEGMPRSGTLLLTNCITGLVAGGFFFYLAWQEKAQRELMCQRMRTIAELNHHIRNALQVIKYYGAAPGQSPESRPVQMIKESAHRIEWALRELLPQYPEDSSIAPSPLPPGYAAAHSADVRVGAFSDQPSGFR